MSTNDMYFADNRTHNQRMTEALLAASLKPNPSLGGALGNALAMGLMGLMERGDDQQKEGAMDRSIGSLAPPSPTVSPDPQRPSPQPTVEAPPAAVNKTAIVQALMSPRQANDFYDNMPGPTQSAAPLPEDAPVPGTPSAGVPLPRANPLGHLNPEMRSKFADLRTEAANRGTYFDAPEAGSIGNVRDQAQQDALFAQGRSAPGPIVTGTRNSNHITGRALDVVPTNGTSEKQVGNLVTALTQNDPRFSGMRSGATFRNLYDPLHVELNQPQGTQVADAGVPFGVGIPPRANAMPTAMAAPPAPTGNPMAQPLLQEAQRRAGVMPNPGTQPNLAPTTQPYAPPTAPAAPPRPVAPQMPQPQALPRDPQMEDAIRQYQSMKPGDPNKQRIYEQIQRMQAEMRTRQLDLSKTDYELQRRNQLEGQQQEAQRSANEASQTRIKQTPTSEEIIKERDRQIGKGQVSELSRRAVDNILKLSEMGSMPDTDRTGFVGKLKNIGAGLDSTEYLGQPLGRIEGSPQQSLRDELTGTGRRLAQSVAQASGMSAKQQDSNVELQSMLSSVGSATGDKWSNLAKIYQIDKLYGNGDLARTLPPEVVQRLEAGSAAAGRPNAAHVDDLVKKYAR